MLAGVTPWPSQITAMRSSSVSKQAQQPSLKLRISPRGVRLSAGQPAPRLRASRTEEKKGKSGSTNGDHAADLAASVVAAALQASAAASQSSTTAQTTRNQGKTLATGE